MGDQFEVSKGAREAAEREFLATYGEHTTGQRVWPEGFYAQHAIDASVEEAQKEWAQETTQALMSARLAAITEEREKQSKAACHERDALEQQLAAAQSELSSTRLALNAEILAGHNSIEKWQHVLAAKEKELAELKESQTGQDDNDHPRGDTEQHIEGLRGALD